MPQIQPLSPDAASEPAASLLRKVQSAPGKVLNFYGTLARAPHALEGFLGLKGALAEGALAPADRERVAITVAQANGCEYCLSAHVGAGRRLGLDDKQIEAARAGTAGDARSAAVVELARALVERRGRVDEGAVERARNAGLTDEEIVETVAHVALNVLTNYVNLLAGTELDLPRVPIDAPVSG